MAPSLSKSLAAIAAAAPVASALFSNGTVIAPCDSPIYCHGEILHQVELARPFNDSKEFVDMPAIRPLREIQAAFDRLEKPLKNDTALQRFLSENFAEAGHELAEVPTSNLTTDADWLDDVNDTVVREFTQKVIDIWPNLTRTYEGSAASNCSECPDSYLPLNRSFVVAGGRFREPYYWDSYWIVEGLLLTGGDFLGISRNIIENFLDFVDEFGFVPNGARKYYLNRSQPPVLSTMVSSYVDKTNDTEILGRAVPLLIKEHDFWTTNRSVDVTVANETYTLNRYKVANTQPRPESYREDYITATNTTYHSESGEVYERDERLNRTQLADVYSNLASGAESGWDYTARWMSRPSDAVNDTFFPLRHLNTINTVPVDLNSILYGNERAIARFLRMRNQTSEAREWDTRASRRSEAMHALMWNETLHSYFDYNLTSSSQNVFFPADGNATAFETDPAPEGMQVAFSVAQFFPFWTGAAADEVKDDPEEVGRAYARVAQYLETGAGGIPATNLRTGQQWDEPSVWPPLMHILISGMLNNTGELPASNSTGTNTTTPSNSTSSSGFPVMNVNSNSTVTSYNNTEDLALAVAQRYLDSTFCTWYATGGSTSETPQLEGFTDEDVGIMFEKYDSESTNVAGGGGEYEVVEGFGWSNGVLIWIVERFGNELRRPDCGDIQAADVHPGR